MERTRGNGLVYRPTYIDKRTGERKTASVWWVQYSVRGARLRESSNSRNRREAEAFLRQRLEAAAQGKPVGGQTEKSRFEDLAKGLLDDYRAKGRRTVGRVDDAIGHLRQFFGETRASQITSEALAQYVQFRQGQGAAAATINRELAVVRRAFRLGHTDGKVAHHPDITMLPEKNRRDVFFEAEEWRAVLDELPEYLRPVIATAYITGWRINLEILTLRKPDVDLDSGCLRLAADETNNRRGRSFPLTPALRKLLTRQLKTTAEFERKSGEIVPWLFHHDGRPIRDFRRAWSLACKRAGVAGKVPDDLRRTAVRNLERAGVSRAAAMAIVGHRSESIYRGIAMDDDTVLKESAGKLAAFHKSNDVIKY